MENKNRKTITLLMVFSVIFTVIGTTLAYYNWETAEDELTEVTFTVSSNFSCSADGGGNITSSDVPLAPTDCTNSQYAIKRKVTTNSVINAQDKTVYMDLWLDIEKLDSGFKNSENFKWVFTKEENSCNTDNAISYGTFEGLTTEDKVMLLDSKQYETTTRDDTYYLYIWLDKEETSTSTMNQNFEFKINGECNDLNSPETPVLDNGLIPVILSDNQSNGYKVTATTIDDPSWYNYDNQEWANAVLVKDNGVKSRTDNKVSTTEIDSNDILAYFVWIPRYAYQIWTLEESAIGKEQEIMIEWESANASYRDGTQVDEYRTHPAFWRDNNSNNIVDVGETIAGIWVGKFETTGNTTIPTILPKIAPLVNQNISNQFQTALKFSGGTLSNGEVNFSTTNSYGIELELTSHMMKNSEWGAVAYLSHSKYGINEEITINNFNNSDYNYKTGCGANTTSAGKSSSCSNVYASGISEYPQSTTGNITGIFDMSGGVYEAVMGVFANSDGILWSGYSTSNNSGFNGLLGTSGTEYKSGIPFPTEIKYYNIYKASSGTTISSLTACNGRICYGHGLSETKSWYGDYFKFVSADYPWFKRGGYESDKSLAGLFNFIDGGGTFSESYGFRSILIPKSVGELQLVS